MSHTIKLVNYSDDDQRTVSRVIVADDYVIEERADFVSITINRENKDGLWFFVGKSIYEEGVLQEDYAACYIENQDGKTIAKYVRI